jgi:repressor LexA
MPNNENLTSTQEQALVAYRKLSEKKGEPPTVRELALALGKSHTAAHALIGQLRNKGYLSMKPVTIIRPTLTKKGRTA